MYLLPGHRVLIVRVVDRIIKLQQIFFVIKDHLSITGLYTAGCGVVCYGEISSFVFSLLTSIIIENSS